MATSIPSRVLRICIVCFIIVLGLTTATVQAQHAIPASVLGSGGGTTVGAAHTLTATVGQPLTGTTAGLRAGFWYIGEGMALTTDLEDRLTDDVPRRFDLRQNYPNPFNPSTMIQYTLPEPVHVRLVVYDMLGRVVYTLTDARQTAGAYRVAWDGRNAAGASVASGVYLYRLEAGDHVESKTMLLVR